MSLLLRRRAMMSAMGESYDPDDGLRVWALFGSSSTFTAVTPHVAWSSDYGQTFSNETAVGGSLIGFSRNSNQGCSNLALLSPISASVDGWNPATSAYRINTFHSTYQTHRGNNVFPIFSTWCTSYPIATDTYYFFGVESGSNNIRSGKVKFSGSRVVTVTDAKTYSNTVSMSYSASACSKDGHYAVIGGTNQGKSTYVSTNYGSSWAYISLLGTSSYDVGVNDVAMTPDGKTTILATNYGIVYSMDYCVSWQRAGTVAVTSCCINEKGTRGAFSFGNGTNNVKMFTIKDFVLTTGSACPIHYVYKVRCNAGGNRLVATRGSSLYYSLDKGSSWGSSDIEVIENAYSSPAIYDIQVSRTYKT